ncbi:dTDP-4-dehydrorhamnose reductase family protein [Roseateles sp. BYS87W]|uniref:dTDP-4-dehydrorhamnose reductase n=1 Tax=Pelomonas baiyunensis TaxID=3299026 RepID=A0ABW7H486_9BURK
MNGQKLLVLGANGMLGHVVLRWFAAVPGCQVVGTVRSGAAAAELRRRVPQAELIDGFDAARLSSLRALFEQVRPDVVINCIGVVKQLAGADDPSQAIPINALLPHRLARLCEAHGARLVHISTDCVFSGNRGHYSETDDADAIDLYGRSKLMGEVVAPHAVTLRTSIIGHEMSSAHALLGWFLSQRGVVPGYSNAIFSALPTVELARVIEKHVLARPELSGIHHVAGPTINKYELLRMVARVYGSDSQVEPVQTLVIDRSLNGERFQQLTGYVPPPWTELLESMRSFG